MRASLLSAMAASSKAEEKKLAVAVHQIRAL
ncbi:MAG: hypothetical protein Hyperionvirus5_79 [Hyperionvirus sp.]|uniref:Uncharacterized protein n=1 Tax=Hyperionvirus sp. TaxID=2487770 RepID=A0A3G5ABM4_9VIRU|nr:MAG: hypothetical protein Hyperionvirus5_79 [Hyperionvirus sp.]